MDSLEKMEADLLRMEAEDEAKREEQERIRALQEAYKAKNITYFIWKEERDKEYLEIVSGSPTALTDDEKQKLWVDIICRKPFKEEAHATE